MSQSRKHSAFEAVANVAIGYCIAVAAQSVIFPLFDIHNRSEIFGTLSTLKVEDYGKAQGYE